MSKVYQFSIHDVAITNRSILLVDKLEQMLGSYGPSSDGKPYIKNFDPEESPSGMLARSGSYNVRSRVIDDDGEVYAGMTIITNITHIITELVC